MVQIVAWGQITQPQGGGKLTPLLTMQPLDLCVQKLKHVLSVAEELNYLTNPKNHFKLSSTHLRKRGHP
jgi:hypothetical protein